MVANMQKKIAFKKMAVFYF